MADIIDFQTFKEKFDEKKRAKRDAKSPNASTTHNVTPVGLYAGTGLFGTAGNNPDPGLTDPDATNRAIQYLEPDCVPFMQRQKDEAMARYETWLANTRTEPTACGDAPDEPVTEVTIDRISDKDLMRYAEYAEAYKLTSIGDLCFVLITKRLQNNITVENHITDAIKD